MICFQRPTDYNYGSHVVPTPNYLTVLQSLIVILSAAIIGLTSYALNFNDCGAANGFMNVVAVVTIIAVGYMLISSLIRGASASFHRIAHLVLLVLAICLWGAAFISEAQSVGGRNICSVDMNGRWVCIWQNNFIGRPYRGTMIAAASLGGVVFFLLIIDLVVYSVFFHRHRVAGGPPNWRAWQNSPQTSPQNQPNIQQAKEENSGVTLGV